MFVRWWQKPALNAGNEMIMKALREEHVLDDKQLGRAIWDQREDVAGIFSLLDSVNIQLQAISRIGYGILFVLVLILLSNLNVL